MFFLLIFSIFSVSAAVLDIRTLPNHDLWITSKHPVNTEQSILTPMKFSSNENGSLIITYEIDQSFLLNIKLKNGVQEVLRYVGEEIYDKNDYVKLDIFPEGYVPPVREPSVILEQQEEVPEIIDEENISIEEITPKESSFTLPSIKLNRTYAYYFFGAIVLILFLFFIFRTKKISKKIKCIDKKIKNTENKLDKLRQKKKNLLLKAKEEMIKREESLIKLRGGSVPEKKEEKSMVDKLKESMKKDGNN